MFVNPPYPPFFLNRCKTCYGDCLRDSANTYVAFFRKVFDELLTKIGECEIRQSMKGILFIITL